MPNLNIDKKHLDNLSEAEKRLVLDILKEYSETGHSQCYEELKYADYREKPVDIETFLTDDNYLGLAWKDAAGKSKLYPFWLQELKKLFPTPFDTDYNTLLESGARGIGKSEIACGAVATYLMHRLLCLKNPLEFYHLKPTEKICFAFMNIKLDLAEEVAISKFQNTLQMSPWFMRFGKMTQRKNMAYWVPPDPLNVIIGSQSDDIIGKPIFFAFFDEISFIRNQDIEKQKIKAKDMIDTAIGGMMTRFVHNGKNPTVLAVASSKRSEQSFMEQYIKSLSEHEGTTTLIVDKPVWEVKPLGTYKKETFYVGLGNKYLENILIPKEHEQKLHLYRDRGYSVIKVPLDFKSKFEEDIDRGLCDFAGISTANSNKYFSGPRITAIETETYKNAFICSDEILKISDAKDDTAQYYDFFDVERIPQYVRNKPLFIHLDMSISGDKTGIAGVFIKGKKPPQPDQPASKDLYYTIGFNVSIEAPKGHQVSFEKNRNFIRWLKQQGFNIKGISADTFQSASTLQLLHADGFNTSTISVDRVDPDHICKPYQYLKTAIYEERIECYKSTLLKEELIGLERNNNTGKIDHTPNGINSKDSADAVCGAIWNASQHAEEFALDYGEMIQLIVDNNTNENEIDDFNKAFEEELMNTLRDNSVASIPNEQDNFLDFGMGKAQPYGSLVSEGILVF